MTGQSVTEKAESLPVPATRRQSNIRTEVVTQFRNLGVALRGGLLIIRAGGFSSAGYLLQYTDVADAGIPPMRHFFQHGVREGRSPRPQGSRGRAVLHRFKILMVSFAIASRNALRKYPRLESILLPIAKLLVSELRLRQLLGPPVTSWVLRADEGIVPTSDRVLVGLAHNVPAVAARFRPFEPLNVVVDEALGSAPSLNILLPSLRREHATGGPNTAFLLGCLLAERDVPVRFIGTDVANEPELNWLIGHLSKLSGLDISALPVTFADASDRGQPFGVGRNDAVLATAWWTAQMTRGVVAALGARHFYYLIQDYEPSFYGASENWAQATATYDMPHVPIINTSVLRDHLIATRIGRFADPDFAARALSFEPAVDRGRFHRGTPREPGKPRRLLVYARPSHPRNLFGLAIAALSAAVEGGLFADGAWEFIGMGERFESVPLGRGQHLVAAPWLSFDDYAEQMRSAEILVSLMLSPHPSYPPLEMAACGGVVVTTTLGTKTAARLAQLSPSIIAAEPAIEPLLQALGTARRMADDMGRVVPVLALPASWKESLAPLVPRLLEYLAEDGVRADASTLSLPPPVRSTASALNGEFGAYHAALRNAVPRRYRPAGSKQLLSLVTTAYDTDPQQLADLAHSLFAQDAPPDFEWLLLDNGSLRADTRSVLNSIGLDPRVRLERAEQNLGIIGGMRWCLENSRYRYIVPIDSDDLLAPHALRSVAAFLEQAGFPALIYTDEDKFDDEGHRDFYPKPEWDPVLFAHSCFIAHLTALDRQLALELDCYGDKATEGSHDWDSFTRFLLAGHQPLHLAECVYSWRRHANSTSANIGVKSYVVDSQRAVLDRFLAGRGLAANIDVEQSPLFPRTPDWRLILLTPGVAPPTLTLKPDDQGMVSRNDLLSALAELPPTQAWIHLHDPGCAIVSPLWESEAAALATVFPDTAMIGGRVHDGRVILEGAFAFGFGGMIGSPDCGRHIADPGLGAQVWKPHSVGAVSARHAVLRRGLLAAALQLLPERVPLSTLGGWFGAVAAERGDRIVYTPFFEARATSTALGNRGEDKRLAGRYGHLVRRELGYPNRLDRSGKRANLPGDPTARVSLPTYDAWLADRITYRAASAAKQRARVGLLTTVYIGTDADLFQKTADAVHAQTQAPLEWMVLAHGPAQGALDAILDNLAAKGRIRLLRIPENLGIAGGLRYALEHATADFCLSLDADDLLTPDAVALLSAAIDARPEAKLIYSDEDHLIGGVPMHPWHRPDHDPALMFAHSWIWHSIAFHRTTGLRLGVYTDRQAEYAQDWDTLLRFHWAGHMPVHLPEVVYHWRQHEKSLSHSGKVFSGSIDSVRHLLNRIAIETGVADRCSVGADPFHSAIPSFRLLRSPEGLPSFGLVELGQRTGPSCEDRDGGIDFANRAALTMDRGPSGLAALQKALDGIEADFVLLLSAGVKITTWRGVGQAVLHLEMQPDVLAVGGPLIGESGMIETGPIVALPDGGLHDSLAGRAIADPGPFSLAHRPHCVSVLGPDLLIVRTAALRALLAVAPATATLRGFATLLGDAAGRDGRRLVYEPVFSGVVTESAALLGDPVGGLEPGWRRLRGVDATPNQGMAALFWGQLHHG